MRFFLALMAVVSFAWGLLGAFATGVALYRDRADLVFFPASIAMAPWLGLMTTGALLFAAAEVLGYVQRRMREMDKADRGAAAQARVVRQAEKQARKDARALKRASRRGGDAEFQILGGGQ